MKYGLDIPTAGKYADARTLAELAAEAEGAGWDGFFTWDVLFSSNQASIPVVDPWIALAAIAQSGTLGWPTKGGWPHDRTTRQDHTFRCGLCSTPHSLLPC